MVTVTRDGQQQNIAAQEIVKGDVVHIKTGEKIPADFRVFRIDGDLQLDNSPLSGESIGCSAALECGDKGKDNALEAKNLAFFSTNCKEGRGSGIVIRIGVDTFIGKIANLASDAGSNETTLQREINRFIKLIACIAVYSFSHFSKNFLFFSLISLILFSSSFIFLLSDFLYFI